MSSQEFFVEHFARLFDHYQQALNSGKDESGQAETWSTVPADELNRLVTAARLAIMEIETNAQMNTGSRKYFAKPGQAEWGC